MEQRGGIEAIQALEQRSDEELEAETKYKAAALAILGAMSAIAMHFTPERQRLGDLLADTWVVRSPATSGAPAPVAAPSARAPSA